MALPGSSGLNGIGFLDVAISKAEVSYVKGWLLTVLVGVIGWLVRKAGLAMVSVVVV